eukprot:UN10765
MKQMVAQNVELKQFNRANLEALELDQYTKFQCQTLSTALNDADTLQQEISAQNDQYKDLNVGLIEEDKILKQQHKKYQLALENMKRNAQKKEIEYQNKIEMLENKIVEGNNEQNKMSEKYEQISNELNLLKQETRQQFKKQIEALSAEPDVGGVISDNKTLRLNFMHSVKVNELHSMDSVVAAGSHTFELKNKSADEEKEQLLEKYVAKTNELNQQIVAY